MNMMQLEPTIPVDVEGKGKGYAFAMIDYGQEHDLLWVVGMNETGECWCVPNPKIRLQANWSMGRNDSHKHTANHIANQQKPQKEEKKEEKIAWNNLSFIKNNK